MVLQFVFISYSQQADKEKKNPFQILLTPNCHPPKSIISSGLANYSSIFCIFLNIDISAIRSNILPKSQTYYIDDYNKGFMRKTGLMADLENEETQPKQYKA